MNRWTVFGMVALVLWSSAACRKKSSPDLTSTSAPSQSTPMEPSPGEPLQTTEPGLGELDAISKRLQPIFFDFDRFDIRDDQASSLKENAQILKENTSVSVILEGHCDERGTDEYNLALGERRATKVRDYLVDLGIDSNRIQTISYGESKPFAYGRNEESWQENRRAQSVVLRQQ